MKLSIAPDGMLIGPTGRTYGQVLSIDIELYDDRQRLTATEIRDVTACPTCDAKCGERCHDLDRGNHAKRVRLAIGRLDGRSILSERSERCGNSAVVKGPNAVQKKEENPYGVKEERPTATQLEDEAIARIWAYYLQIVPSRRQLDAKRTRIIRSALRTIRSAQACEMGIAEQAVKRAVLGLSRSPHHNGENDQRRTYLEIRYALKGIGDESDDERIEKAISWAALYAPGGSGVLDPAKAQRYLDDIRYTLSLGHRPEGQRAREAFQKLREAGFGIERLEQAPWARLAR